MNEMEDGRLLVNNLEFEELLGRLFMEKDSNDLGKSDQAQMMEEGLGLFDDSIAGMELENLQMVDFDASFKGDCKVGMG